ncbi:hypothetical protein AGOR_G00028550 [Albula goreensis]|uniref:BRCA1-A complex subunit RAP80 n=1 Tax=Albula goreensis TaxID=1534307 RepID=A0A8T3E2F4_9TELE|nr:hypothetical protein AGOR_G00028550 [Albula goreensis]
MPRKKRVRKRDNDDDRSTFPSKRRHAENKGEPLVISDSENEDEEYKPTTREDRSRGRESKAQTRDLTEEEMLDLAMRLSEQEAGNAARIQQQEEEAMRKAIAESLHVMQQANGTQTDNENFELLSSAMTPSHASQPSSSQSPPQTAESPVFPPKKKHMYLSQSKAEDDTVTADQSTTTIRKSTDENQELISPHGHPHAPSQAPPNNPETPPLPLLASEEVTTHQRKELDTDSSCSSKSCTQAGKSPVLPKSPADGPVVCIEKLSQDLVKDCHSVGFVLCSQDDPSGLTASDESPSSLQAPESPTFPQTDRRQDGKACKDGGAESYPEPVAATVMVSLGDEESSEVSPQSQGHCQKDKESCKWTPKLKNVPSSQRLTPAEGTNEDTNRHGDFEGQTTDHCKNQSCPSRLEQTSKLSGQEGVLENVDENTSQPQPNQGFSTQMTLNWSEDEDENDEVPEEKTQECLNVAQVPSHQKSQNAVFEQSSISDSESLLRVVSGSVPSPVFRRDPIRSKLGIAGASPGLVSPTNRPGPLPTTPVRASGARCVRKKFTFMHTTELGESSHSGTRSTRAGSSLQARLTPAPSKKQQGEGAVLYYWGVPFCPRGQNPDDYTQVILTQLEVYEKSLKEARRGLLRKAEWGEPVLPGPPKRPFSRRSSLKRHRASRPLEDEEEQEEAGEEVVGEEEPVVVEEVEEAVEEDERARLQKGPESGGGVECETQDSQATQILSLGPTQEVKSPLHYGQEEPSEKLTFLRRRGLRERSPIESETQVLAEEEEEEEEGMCPETQLSEENTLDVNMESPTGSQPRPDSEVMEVVEDGNGNAPAAAEEDVRMEVEMEVEGLELAAQTQSQRVECPMCMRNFPLLQIEMHAAYCDGTTEDSVPEESQSQVMVLRKSARRTEVIGDQSSSSETGKVAQGEKCFICQGLFPVKEYGKHVEACIALRNSTANEGTKGLLTALDRSEQRDSEAGPSHSAFRNKEHSRSATLGEADESGGSGDAAFTVSTSPIKSFTPISEATDCLIDFKRQYSSKPSQRAGRKRKYKR